MSRQRARRVCAWVLTAALLAPVAARAADDVRIVPLVRDGQVLVSCEIPGAYTDEVREVIQSGLPTTFTYTVELRVKAAMWVDRTIAAVVVSSTVEYDNLTRRHSVSRTLDGRVEEARVVEDEATVQRWLTAFDRLPLFRTSKLEPNREYYVLVRARPRSAATVWPWDGAVSGSAKFTFLK